MIRRNIRICLSAMVGALVAWLLFRLSFAYTFQEAVTIRWQLAGYWTVYFSLLGLAAAVYLRLDRSPTAAKVFLAGTISGLLVSVLAIVMTSWARFGLEGFARGWTSGGLTYGLVVVAAALVPLSGWLFGLAALAVAVFVDFRLGRLLNSTGTTPKSRPSEEPIEQSLGEEPSAEVPGKQSSPGATSP